MCFIITELKIHLDSVTKICSLMPEKQTEQLSQSSLLLSCIYLPHFLQKHFFLNTSHN